MAENESVSMERKPPEKIIQKLKKTVEKNEENLYTILVVLK